MIAQEPNIKTVFIILLFACWYLYRIAQMAGRQQLDLYDLIILSTVAIIPSAFVLFPHTAYFLTHLIGVAYPFVILFGALLAILFIFIHRLTRKLHQLESSNRILLQEISLLQRSDNNKDQNKVNARREG